MFSLGVELLMRRAIMAQTNDREKAEWPPHPDRVFMALVAAWGEAGEDTTQRRALEWLERLGAPSLSVPLETSERTSLIRYVPVNDDSAPLGKKGLYGTTESMPIGRNRQPRYFPAVIPSSPVFHLLWDTTLPEEIRAAMEGVCQLVTYLGHSATPVRVWVEDRPQTANLVPDDLASKYRLRTFSDGRLSYLKRQFDVGLYPQPSLWQGYSPCKNDRGKCDEEPHEGLFDQSIIILRQVGGRPLFTESCGIVAAAFRQELTQRYGIDPPEWLTGHESAGFPSRKSRPAFFPLAFVDCENADGRLMGVAIAVPRHFAHGDELLRLLGAHQGYATQNVEAGVPFLALTVYNPCMGNAVVGEICLELDERPESRRQFTLRSSTWTHPRRVWSSVTPIVLSKFPRHDLSPEEIIARSCEDIGLPRPDGMMVSTSPLLSGVPHARDFHVVLKQGRPTRPLVHARITFPIPVRGPVLLGAGRHYGYGICRSPCGGE